MVKVSELTGAKLDYWVAKAEGFEMYPDPATSYRQKEYRGAGVCIHGGPIVGTDYSPSSNWSQGGPLIEREGIATVKFFEPVDGPTIPGHEWAALSLNDKTRMDGPTPLIAGMRCLVASKFGEEVTE